MSRKCNVCRSVDRAAIDELLIAGRSIRQVAEQFGLSKSTLHRHRKHLVGHVPKQLGQGLVMVSEEELDRITRKAEAYDGLEYVVKRIQEVHKIDPVDQSFAFFVSGNKIHLAVFLDGSENLKARLNRIVKQSIDEGKDVNEIFEAALST